MIKRVVLILDPLYADKLKLLSEDTPVWIVSSSENLQILDQLRSVNSQLNFDITNFSLKEGERPPHACERIIDSLDQHYNEYSLNGGYVELDVIGVIFDEVSTQPFSELGFTKFVPTDNGFIAYKI